MFCRHPKWAFLLFMFAPLNCAHAQYEVPDEIFQRTLLIRSGDEQATGFKFDQDGRIYLVTTRHFGRNLPLTKAVVQAWSNQSQTWKDVPIVRTLFPAAKDVDLAVVETSEKIEKPYRVIKSSEVLTTGEKVWFMGWLAPMYLPKMPTNMPKTQRPLFPDIPNYVKIGMISAINPTRPDSFEISFQGWYAARSAGGPIIYWSPVHKDFEILGVVKREKSAVDTSGVEGHTSETTVPSSTLKGYSIDIVVEVIRDESHSPPSR